MHLGLEGDLTTLTHGCGASGGLRAPARVTDLWSPALNRLGQLVGFVKQQSPQLGSAFLAGATLDAGEAQRPAWLLVSIEDGAPMPQLPSTMSPG